MTTCQSCGEPIRCRGCGAEYQGRREEGRGSYVPKGTPLSKNEEVILEVFKEAIKAYPYGCTRRQISGVLFNSKPLPVMESGKSWDAHYVQSCLSRLLGRGLISARKMEKGNALLYSNIVSPDFHERPTK